MDDMEVIGKMTLGKETTYLSVDSGTLSPLELDRKLTATTTLTPYSQEMCEEKLAQRFGNTRKWCILGVLALVQISMNFNPSVYANANMPMAEHFGVSEDRCNLGLALFLIAYAFGSELWAPWSEDCGRWPVMQLSLLFVNIWQIQCIAAPNIETVLAGRFLGGLSSAGGSVTLGIVADLYSPNDQQYGVAFICFASVCGAVVGPVAGGFIEQYLSWRWNFIIQLILGVATQVLHGVFVPETRATSIVYKAYKKAHKAGEPVTAPEDHADLFNVKHILSTWYRPFKMFFTEPIVFCCSMLSGFSDSLIFLGLSAVPAVLNQWDFTLVQKGLAFLSILVGYVLAYLAFIPWISHDRHKRSTDPKTQPESRLSLLLWIAPLLPIGLIGFAWTSLGPERNIPWIAPLIFTMLIGAANYAIYMATIDYMVASYGEYSASATGGNALARDLLAGIAVLYAKPLYTGISQVNPLEWASTLLAALAVCVVLPVYVIYAKGPAIRRKSKFAETMAEKRTVSDGRQHIDMSV